MVKIDFDNIRKLIRVDNTLNAGSIVSTEITLDLPRGYIAKIRRIKFAFLNWSEDLEGTVAVEISGSVQSALVRDPDDTLTIQTPENSSSHDVIGEHKADVFAELGNAHVGNDAKEYYFDENIDVPTARNLRFNTIGQGADVASLTESVVRCEIEYTYEKIDDKGMLDLLDIL